MPNHACPDFEFQLLTALTHPNEKLGSIQVHELVHHPDVDWSRLIDLSEWHRVVPQCFRNLQEYQSLIPAAEWNHLHRAAHRCQRQSLARDVVNQAV